MILSDFPPACLLHPAAAAASAAHIEIESDPALWRHVESLIRAQLPPIPVKQ
jgi:hypothetical protein